MKVATADTIISRRNRSNRLPEAPDRQRSRLSDLDGPKAMALLIAALDPFQEDGPGYNHNLNPRL